MQQAGVAILAIVVATILQYVQRPFWDKRVNALDCLCCMSVMVHCIASLYYNNADFVQPGSTRAARLDALLVAVNILTYFAIAGLFVVTALEDRFKHSATKALSFFMADTVVALQQDLGRKRDGLLRELVPQGDAKDSDGTGAKEGVVHVAQFVRAAQRTLEDAGQAVSPTLIEGLYFVLLLVDDDHEARESVELSKRMRELLVTEGGLRMQVVRSLSSAGGCRTPKTLTSNP